MLSSDTSVDGQRKTGREKKARPKSVEDISMSQY